MDETRHSGDSVDMNDRLGARHRGLSSPLAQRGPARALFRRLFVINGLLFTVGALMLALSPATGSAPFVLAEMPVLLVGLASIVTANAVLVRSSLGPLDELASLMQRVDLLRTGDRMADSGNGDLLHLIKTFNGMLDRLEAERKASSAHALAAQEGERQRIARELHDEIGQSLTVVLLSLKRSVDRAPYHLRDELHGTQDAIRDCLDEVRQVARRLRPGVLEDLGLHAALVALCSEFSKVCGVTVTRSVDNSLPALDGDVELVIYRIAQESLTNVARHAHASQVDFSLATIQHELILQITDNGRGGDIREGAGIRGMRERASLIGSRLEVTAPPGSGTTVRLTIPTVTERS